ncbi:MAG: aminotransferase class V-fold PLP-dependent enzyme [Pirellulaceae bacterium]
MADTSLELDGDAMRRLLDAVMRRVAPFLDTLDEQPSWNTHDRQRVARTLIEPLPQTGTDADALLDRLFDEIIPCSFNTAGPGYLAFIPGGGLPHTAAADVIADTVNRYVGFWPAAPAVAQLEATAIGWLCEIVGYGDGAGGFFTSGGSQANFSGLFTARRCRLGDDLTRGVLYTSDQAHASVRKAAMLAGFAPDRVRVISSDARQRLDLERLRSQVAADRQADYQPFAVVANAGTTNTGAVDDLDALADLCERENLWLHVDAAYGGFFLLTERGRQRMRGIERADSVVLDPHKGMFLPYGTGSLLARRADDLRDAHRVGPAPADRDPQARASGGDRPDYMRSSLAYYNMPEDGPFSDFQQSSPELSRPFRGLRVWLPLKLHGVEPFRRNLEEKLDLAQFAVERLRAMPHIEIVAEPELSLLAFRVTAEEQADGDRLNERVLELVNSRRRVFLSPTTLAGRLVLRICVLNFRTHREHLERCLEDIAWAVEQTIR